jgi:hypothetical protein
LDDVWHHERFCPVPAVERILSDRLAAVERDRDRFRGLMDEYHGRLGDYVETHGPLLQRAETAEAEVERLWAVGAKVEALLDWPVGRPTNGVDRMIPASDLTAALATAPVQAGTGAQDEAWAASIHKVPLTPEAKQRRAERLRAAQPTEHEQGEEGRGSMFNPPQPYTVRAWLRDRADREQAGHQDAQDGPGAASSGEVAPGANADRSGAQSGDYEEEA